MAGDLEARSAIVDQHQQMVYNLALKLTNDAKDAECVLQEAFLKIFENLGSFRGESSLRTWIYRITTNAALMLLRRRKGAFASMDDDQNSSEMAYLAQMLKSLDKSPLELVLDAEFQTALQKALAELPDSWRVAFVLKDIEGLSLQEIAESLGTTVAAVKAVLHRGRKALRDRLSDFMEHQRDQVRKTEIG
ncbi:MAG: sigma-70 family RNA polymerase sigma factor [bacterium]